ncbi:MAG: DVU_1556 family methyltransferase [Syntrophobacteraceae bacterium]
MGPCGSRIDARARYDVLCGCWAADEPIRPGGLSLTRKALSQCSFPAGARLVDIGCGMGITVASLAGFEGWNAVGVDPSFALLKGGRGANSRLPLLCAAGEHLPLASASWDGAILECSLSVCADRDRVLGECRRILKQGGRLIVSDLYRRSPSGGTGPAAGCLAGAFDRDELFEKLATFDFHVTFWEDQTDALKHFAARLILSGSPVVSLWGLPSFGRGGPFPPAGGIKPGYFLLVAELRADGPVSEKHSWNGRTCFER